MVRVMLLNMGFWRLHLSPLLPHRFLCELLKLPCAPVPIWLTLRHVQWKTPCISGSRGATDTGVTLKHLQSCAHGVLLDVPWGASASSRSAADTLPVLVHSCDHLQTGFLHVWPKFAQNTTTQNCSGAAEQMGDTVSYLSTSRGVGWVWENPGIQVSN